MASGQPSSTASTETQVRGADRAGEGLPQAQRRDQVRLAFASFLMLFVELALIRWITANNVYVTEATNFVLLASFLGIGIGFLNAASGRDYLRWTPLALLALVAFVLAFPVVLHIRSGPDQFTGTGNTNALPQPVSFAVIFLLTVAVMTGLGQGVARVFIRFRPLSAYRLDILGSIAGIVLFSLLSFLDQPPATWGAIACAGLILLLLPSVKIWQVAAAGAVFVLLLSQSLIPHQSWSPYNKLTLQARHGNSTEFIWANNIPFQGIHPLAKMRRAKQFYFYPYQHVTRATLGNVLVIGAGNGNDVAVALSEGARHVDAVEIDPRIVQIGRQYHPNHPYQSPRVTIHIADGRQYLQDTTEHYNLIVYALPDSLTALAGQSAIRLESYLLTDQALAAARAHLAPGGTFAMYNYYAPFVLDRYATTVEDVFHRVPCAQTGWAGGGRMMAVLTVRPVGPVPNCTSFWHGTRLAPATDDRPFPYLRNAAIPGSYLWILGAILLASVLLVRIGGGPFRRMSSYLDLAFMGAAFLLLETKSIVQFALLFGTTWFVNSLVFAGVLVAVYLAVETARWVRLPPPAVLYGALIAALAVAWVVPQDALLGLSAVPRFLAASALAFAPIYIANLVFAQRFSGVETAGTAFAANLLGAMAGGTLEYISLITGYRFLLIVTGVLYGLAFVTWAKRKRASPPAQAPGA
jgi:Spermine/spermidine synthase domain